MKKQLMAILLSLCLIPFSFAWDDSHQGQLEFDPELKPNNDSSLEPPKAQEEPIRSNHKSPYPNLDKKEYAFMTLTNFPKQFRIGREKYYTAYQNGELKVGTGRLYRWILGETTFEEIGVEYELEKISKYKPTKYRPEIVRIKIWKGEEIDA